MEPQCDPLIVAGISTVCFVLCCVRELLSVWWTSRGGQRVCRPRELAGADVLVPHTNLTARFHLDWGSCQFDVVGVCLFMLCRAAAPIFSWRWVA